MGRAPIRSGETIAYNRKCTLKGHDSLFQNGETTKAKDNEAEGNPSKFL